MVEKIKESFETGNGFMAKNEFKITKLTKDICVMEIKNREEFLNPYGIVHGGILFGSADSAAGALACMSGKMPVTLNASMNYLSMCKGSKIIVEATILKQGNNIGYYNVNIYDEEKKLVAQANVNMYLKDYEKK